MKRSLEKGSPGLLQYLHIHQGPRLCLAIPWSLACCLLFQDRCSSSNNIPAVRKQEGAPLSRYLTQHFHLHLVGQNNNTNNRVFTIVLGTVLKVLPIQTRLFIIETQYSKYCYHIILQMQKLRHREVNYQLVRDEAKIWNLHSLMPESVCLTTVLHTLLKQARPHPARRRTSSLLTG